MLNLELQRTIQLLLFCLLLMLLGLNACQTTPIEPTDKAQADAIIQGFIDAQNAGDVEGALAFLNENTVIQLIPPPVEGDDGVFTGKEEIRAWYENLAALHGKGELSEIKVEGDQVTAILTYSDDGLKQIGVNSIDNEWVVTIQDGKIQHYTATLTEASLAELMAAMAAGQAE